jgi:hypothetical protein
MSVPSNPLSAPGPEVKFGLWAAPESPLTVEYSLVVIEEIRHDVTEGYQRLSRGGIEVGGVLYGTHEGRTVRVLAMRPIACEHARGPGFAFSDKDRINLQEQLQRDKEDPHLDGLVSVGWFLSHTRTEIFLNESDQEIFSIFFPAPWQVTMVVRPGRNGAMRAGFFVRDAEGAVHGDRSYLEFNFPDRLQTLLDRPVQRPPRERPERRGPSLRHPEPDDTPGRDRQESRERLDPGFREGPRDAADQAADAPPGEASEMFGAYGGPQLIRPAPARGKWLWLVGWAAMLILAAVFGLRYWMANSTVEPISLSVLEHDGQLRIEWNHAAKPVESAVSGSLEIVDGTKSQIINLSRTDLTAGKFVYLRKTGDVEVRMTVLNAEGEKTQEASRYLGRPPEVAPGLPGSQGSQDLADLQKRRDELEAEVQRLQQQNSAQAARIQQLDRLLRVLQSRLGIDSAKQ